MTKSAALHLWAFFYPKSGANAVEDVGMVIHERKKVIRERKKVIHERKIGFRVNVENSCVKL